MSRKCELYRCELLSVVVLLCVNFVGSLVFLMWVVCLGLVSSVFIRLRRLLMRVRRLLVRRLLVRRLFCNFNCVVSYLDSWLLFYKFS